MSKLATHESAHAVLRVVLGGGVEYATIDANNPHVRPTAVLKDADERVVTVAGIVAEFAFYPEESRVGHFGGDDLERAASWSDAEERQAIQRAKVLVLENSDKILRLANELERNTVVLGERVREIVKS